VREGGWSRFGQPLAALAVTCLCLGTLVLSQYALKVWGPPLEFLQFLMPLLAIGGLGWLAIACVQRLSRIVVAAYALRETSLDAQLILVVGSLVAIAIGIATLFYAADYIGVPLGPLMAGLGIGGLAVALAVRPTLENVIGGLTLFADRPARVGEFCRIGAETGTIEEIGLRTTKIRRLDDTIVTIPNADLAQTRIQNLSRRRRFPFEMQLALPIGTTGEQVQAIAEQIEAVLSHHDLVNPDTVRVLLTGFGEKTMTLELRAHVAVTRNSAFLAVQHELQLRILEIVREGTAEPQSSTPR
jgi:MscS family membrane protein